MAAGDVTLAHGASTAYTITCSNLIESATRVFGRESTAVATGAWLDVLIGGKLTTGTTPTADELIDIWIYAALEDTPTYPDVFDGTDSDETVTSVNVRNSALKLLHSIRVDSTTNRVYPFGPFSLAALFGGVLPTHHGLFVTHSTDVNLYSDASNNNSIEYTPVYAQVAQ